MDHPGPSGWREATKRDDGAELGRKSAGSRPPTGTGLLPPRDGPEIGLVADADDARGLRALGRDADLRPGVVLRLPVGTGRGVDRHQTKPNVPRPSRAPPSMVRI